MTDKYKKLSELLIKQEENHSEWSRALYSSIFQVKKQVAESYGLTDKTWKDINTNTDKPYIKILSTSNEKISPENVEINEDGVAKFKLSIILERSEDSFPKSEYLVLLGTKIENGNPIYCIMNSDNDFVDTWHKDLEDLDDAIYKALERQLAYNPMEG